MSPPSPDRRRQALLAGVWLGVGALVCLGLLSAAARATALATGAEPFAVVYPIFPAAAVEDARRLERWFAAQAPLVWLHILAGTIVLGLAPLQFVRRLRERHIRTHRLLGRLVLLAVIPTGLSGILLQLRSPYGGGLALSAILFAGALFLVSATLAYLAILRGDPVRHREWMIRVLAVALGVGSVRLVALPLILLTGRRPLELVGAAFWLGFAVPILAGELWVRATRRTAPSVDASVPAPS